MPDVLGIGWVVVAAGATISRLGHIVSSSAALHSVISFDQVFEFIPWTTLAWTQVHQGHLPLWNPYNALGAPLAFNWQSATFSLPSLLGYLAPARLTYTVSILTTLVVGGTGVYVLGRVMRLGVLGCAMAATVFELSGSFMGWLGSPIASVMSWSGWLFAAIILITRGGHRVRRVAFLAIVAAFTIYAGQLDMLLPMFLAVGVFVVVLLSLRAIGTTGRGPILRPTVDLILAGTAGFALAAPLALPGLQLAKTSVRTISITNTTLPTHDALNVIFQGFNGLPWPGSQFFDAASYSESAAYVGVIVLVLTLTAVFMRRRRPEVIAFAAVVLVMAAVVFLAPLVSMLEHLPDGSSVQWHRTLFPMSFALSVLAGVGTDVVARSRARRKVIWLMGGGFSGAGILLIGLWAFGRGHLIPNEATIRSQSFIWPVLTTVVGLIVVGMLALTQARALRVKGRPSGRYGASVWAAGVLLACETTFLVSAGVPLWSSSPTPLTALPSELALKRAVGPALVGFGMKSCALVLGIPPEANTTVGVREFAAYDPLLSLSYFSSWKAATGASAGPSLDVFTPRSEFCPDVTSATVARQYGISFILEPQGSPGPQGGVFDKMVGTEDLYRIPGAASATLDPLGPRNSYPRPDAPGTAVRVTQPGPGSWKLVTDARTPQVLRLRLADVPGWHATIDGRPLRLDRFSGVMLQARVPSGRHLIELHYWPTAFSVGLVLAGSSGAALLAVGVVAETRRRRRLARAGTGQS